MRHEPTRTYIGGQVECFDFLDIDQFGILDMWDFANALGYTEKGSFKFWLKHENCFRPIETDADVLSIADCIPSNFEVQMFIEKVNNSEGGTESVINDEIGIDETGVELSDEGDDSEDDDIFYESEYDMEDDDKLFEAYVDPEAEIGGLDKGKGMMIKFQKVDKIRLRAVCKKDGCEWFSYVGKMQGDGAWQIKSYNPNHNKCSWNYNNTSIKSGWIGKTFVKKLKENPKLGTSEFRNEVCTTLKANVSRSQAYRAKQKALKLIQGTLEEQFSKIRDYCQELDRSNPGSTVRMQLNDENRPVVGVDGCWLKGNHGGQLLSAVGLDPNNNIYPIAYAIVESETKESWMWFLNMLNIDLNFSENEHTWTFMSDKQKGLIPAFETLFPTAENRYCVRHLHSNMKRDGFTGLAIKSALWAAARATRVEEFQRRMQELKEIDENAYIWLAKKPPQNWSRSHFTTYPKCDILLNNMCECFNSFILDAREKPIISLLESIRNLLMTRIQINREKALKWDGPLCPKIKQVLMKTMKEAGECIPIRSDEWNFQIMGPSTQHSVDVRERRCSCRKWDLTGIPCKHACSAIWCRNEDPESYVHNCYKVETYLKCYETPIFPLNGPELWPASTIEPPLPPNYTDKVEHVEAQTTTLKHAKRGSFHRFKKGARVMV
ncbi:PREDICTED: uncharacterized protein LOC105970499 [Erythranthe guttata]|uniref:uncharacterized protein LOC105970499 n=1 Tax=Erythranthe guttata TaxID=4155 RepID=UPI00064DCB7A|nr:PREDICTED: uncharacterized protein LOC105970499 [Erythranthe guttata]|eukprot:XP_012850789.1 PREDICTED: uncharacterized protein LOC105970499 [Erythranthe guttata]